jgi:hypothetical protein
MAGSALRTLVRGNRCFRVVLVVGLLFAVAGAAPAQAFTGDELDHITEHLYRGGASPAISGVSCGGDCQTFWGREQAFDDASGVPVARELVELRQRTGLLPSSASIRPPLREASVTSSVFGDGARRKWFGFKTPPEATVDGRTTRGLEERYSDSPGSSGGGSSLSPPWENRTPSLGFIPTDQNGNGMSTSVNDWMAGRSWEGCRPKAEESPADPPGWTWIVAPVVASTNYYCSGGPDLDHLEDLFTSLDPRGSDGDYGSVEDYTDQSATEAAVTSWDRAPYSFSNLRDAVADELEGRAERYYELIHWYKTGETAPSNADLLDRYNPRWALDLGEDFLPQNADAFALDWQPAENGDYLGVSDNLVTTLKRDDGSIVAAAGSPNNASAPWPPLSVNFLRLGYHYGSDTYGSAASSDYINAAGSDLDAYHASYHRQRDAGFREGSYDRVVRDPGDGKLWLQYWVFYYANSYDRGGQGVHGGDWEMIQVGLDDSYEPDEVTFSVHDGAVACSWAQVSHAGASDTNPIVYVAAGSHASYPFAGVSNLPGAPGEAGFTDSHNGDGTNYALPRETLSGEPWIDWPGWWGASRTGSTPSPKGPSKQGDKWSHPSQFDSSASGTCSDPTG